MNHTVLIQNAVILVIGTAISLSAKSVDVKFTGTMVEPPPCVINTDNAISVDFGNELLAGRINGVNYEKPVAYILDCSGAESTTLKMQFQGVAAGFDASILGTSKQGLGIELRHDGIKLPVNTWLNFTDPYRPVLTAVPVKDSSSVLSGGAFTAISTLIIDYQ